MKNRQEKWNSSMKKRGFVRLGVWVHKSQRKELVAIAAAMRESVLTKEEATNVTA